MCLGRRSVRLSVCLSVRLSVCPSVNTYSTWHDFSSVTGRNSMKLYTNIQHCWSSGQGQGLRNKHVSVYTSCSWVVCFQLKGNLVWNYGRSLLLFVKWHIVLKCHHCPCHRFLLCVLYVYNRMLVQLLLLLLVVVCRQWQRILMEALILHQYHAHMDMKGLTAAYDVISI